MDRNDIEEMAKDLLPQAEESNTVPLCIRYTLRKDIDFLIINNNSQIFKIYSLCSKI